MNFALLSKLLGKPSAELEKWIKPGRYVTGRELAAAGLADIVDLSKHIDRRAAES